MQYTLLGVSQQTRSCYRYYRATEMDADQLMLSEQNEDWNMSFLLRFFRNAPVIRFQGGFTKKLIPDQYAETVMLRQTPVPKNNFPRFPHAPRLPRQQALAPVDS